MNFLKKGGKTIGFVPTMGALHKGHITLLERAKKENDIAVVSIFVNPLQFNDKKDLAKYPRTLESDLEKLKAMECDMVFAPEVNEIYPNDDKKLEIDLGNLDKVMEGVHRPGHFQGVCVVVKKLFEIVEPARAYFGEKDFQQLAIIKFMVKKLKLPVEIIACPIVRDFDGLALSSRNVFLSSEERKNAALIPKTLFRLQTNKQKATVTELKQWVGNIIDSNPFLKLEYFEIVNAETLTSIQSWKEAKKLRACIAVKVGSIRLIDNISL